MILCSAWKKIHVLTIVFICLLLCQLSWAPFLKVHRVDPDCCLLLTVHSLDLCLCHLQLLLQLPPLCCISSSFLFPFLRPVISELPIAAQYSAHFSLAAMFFTSLYWSNSFCWSSTIVLCLQSRTISLSSGCIAGNFLGVVSCMMSLWKSSSGRVLEMCWHIWHMKVMVLAGVVV